MARAIYLAGSLQNLNLRLENCEAGPVSSPLDAAEIPAPHSFKIQTLKITVRADNSKSTAYNIIHQLHGALSYLLPLVVDISLDRCPFETLYGENGELFPDGSSIKLHIARSLRFETPRADFYASSWSYYSWTRFSSIHHLCFRNCDKLTEYGAKSLANKLLTPGANVDLQSLEFTRCKRVSEECLLNLHDDFGDKLKWTI
ncbi:hypothetical protein BD410DRAFT_846265 [Rickenella mellea]|uniref:F-box domain-containing protein n=1 Tax=Rickenella mellea TaxID=50990 RepID=A0A4Y7PIF1_9AGAM|nr:hypothetical protein BD410DRAFT_846265 [Rickenella mellea]